MKGLIKSYTTDKYLRPIRNQICDLVNPNTSVIEFGCGNGDLLFKLSEKIDYGLGIDISKNLIKHAINKSHKHRNDNLSFKVFNLNTTLEVSEKYDYAVASLLLHILPWHKSMKLLELMLSISHTTILCSFTEPKTTYEKLLLNLDQRFTMHYSNFKVYKKNNYIKGFLNHIPNIHYKSFNSFDNAIEIILIKNKT